MSTYNVLAIVGLSLDMIGVILIFLFGISPRYDIEGQTYIVTGGINKKEIKKAKKFKRLSWFGLFLVFSGFLLQLLNYIIK